MPKQWIAVVGLALIAVGAGVSPLAGQAVPELVPSKVFELAPPAPLPGYPDKSPVISSLAVDGGGLFITAGDDHRARIWNADGTPKHTLIGHTDWVRAAALRPDGRVLATAGDDRQIRYWDATSGQFLRTLPQIGRAHV